MKDKDAEAFLRELCRISIGDTRSTLGVLIDHVRRYWPKDQQLAVVRALRRDYAARIDRIRDDYRAARKAVWAASEAAVPAAAPKPQPR